MDIINFAHQVLGMKLSFYQEELLKLLQNNPYEYLPKTSNITQVKSIYEQWKESQVMSLV